MRLNTLLLLLCLGLDAPHLFAEDFVPYVIPDEVNSDSEIVFDYQPLDQADRLVARDHFYKKDSDERVRIWGVNLSFGANLPSHEDALRVARRLAAAGINSVRVHHLDSADWPRGIWDRDNPAQFHPEALDRLDYFVDQLARCGIYVDLNLHVGREHSRHLGLPEAPERYDKIVSLFTDELVAAQKDYAQRLLSHTNPYRKMTYADDPAIAFVEITNENSFFMWSAPRILPNLPEFYRGRLEGRFNDWLEKKYGNDQALKAAWEKGNVPLGENLITNPTLQIDKNKSYSWILEQHGSAKAELKNKSYQNRPVLCVRPMRIDGTDWHLQLNHRKLQLRAGQTYTVAFAAAAEQPRTIAASVGQAHEPWSNLGFWQEVKLTQELKTCRLTFTAHTGEDNARLNFAFGTSDVPFYLTDVSLQSGHGYQHDPGESLAERTVRFEVDKSSPNRQRDRLVFLAETEKAFFDDMRSYIKNDLGFHGLVTGTIVFGPLGLYGQSDMDYIDTHAYWKHPHFPGRPWDMSNWTVDQQAMTDHPDDSPLYNLGAARLYNKPFAVSEYNHPAPNDYQAEGVPMLASFAAAQDWDGLWLYTYSHSNDRWDRDVLNSFFDVDTNPAKWGFVPTATVLFRNGGMKAIEYPGNLVFSLHDSDCMDFLAERYMKYGRDLLAAGRELNPKLPSFHQIWLDYRMYTLLCQDAIYISPSAPRRISWSLHGEDKEGVYYINDSNCMVLAGHTEHFPATTGGRVSIKSPEFASIVIVSLDQQALRDSKRILVTACGRVENQEMEFSADRRTVGTNWGHGPVQIEAVSGTVRMPGDPFTVRPLNPDGTAKDAVATKTNVLTLGPEQATMHYLLTREP